MNLHIDVPLRFEGIITVECHDGKGELLHEETQKNLIVNNGWASLGDKALGDDLLNTCILGRGHFDAFGQQIPPALTDLVTGPSGMTRFTGIYSPDCPDDPPGTACDSAPVRSMVAYSKDNGGTADVFALVDNGETYWSLVRKRVFDYSTDYFGGGASTAGTCAEFETNWFMDGWGWLNREASYIAELGFCSDLTKVYHFSRDCVVVPEFAPGNTHQGRLWNRILLDQTIGFDSAAPWYPYGPDVSLPLDAVITVTLEMRVHLDKTANVQVINIEGVPTTCSTRVQEIDNQNHWVFGFMRRFGLWPTDTDSGIIGKGNTLPAVTDRYDNGGEQDFIASSRVSTGIGELVQKYHAETWDGNFAGGGVGGIEHANFATGISNYQCFVTVFDPIIAKDDLHEMDFTIRYLWSQA